MNNQKHSPARVLTSVLAVIFLTAGAVLAAGAGTENDPLITMSYLTQTVIPSILTQVDGRAESYQQHLVDELQTVVKDYSNKMEEVLADQQQAEAGASAAYAVVTLTSGQQMNMAVGCEVMLRIGTAECVSPSSPGLIDITTGSAVNNGAALTVNHLCMATISDRAIRATANTVKVLVRGEYTIG